MLNFDGAIPLYKQLVDVLVSDINSGRYKETGKLPTESDLSRLYCVSRITVRKAIEELSERGIVEKHQGKGTFLKDPPIKKSFTSVAYSFTEMCAQNGKVASSKLLEATILHPYDNDVIEAFNLGTDDEVVKIVRLRYADEKPVVVEENIFPIEFSFLLSQDLENISLYEYLRDEVGIEIIPSKFSLHLAKADYRTAGLLNIPRNSPVLKTWSIANRRDGKILHTCRQIGYADNFVLVVR